MSITVDDLRRLYPFISGGEEAAFDGHTAILGKSEPRGWRVTLYNPRTRQVGRLLFPLAGVEIEAWGFEKSEFEQLLDRIHLVFRRGGG
jgi:hypothetical protein